MNDDQYARMAWRIGYYVIAAAGACCLIAGLSAGAMWFALMAPIAFMRGRMWEE